VVEIALLVLFVGLLAAPMVVLAEGLLAVLLRR